MCARLIAVCDYPRADMASIFQTLGGKFALSPINPLGFIPECKRVGLLAVPSGLSSNECWDLKRQGAKMIKLFHAGQVTAKILK